ISTPVLRIRTDAHKTARALRDFDGSNVCVASRLSTNMWLAPGGADFQFCSYVFSNCNLQSVRAARCLCWNVSLLRRCFPLGSPQARGLVFRVDCQLCSSGLSLCRLAGPSQLNVVILILVFGGGVGFGLGWFLRLLWLT